MLLKITFILVGHLMYLFHPPVVSTDAIEEVKKLGVNAKAFEKSKPTKPIEIKSEDDAKKYFDEKQLEKLLDKVDFDKQKILVFAWKGSGRDKLEYDVAESYPEQITFRYTAGRTRDLRSHTRVYVLRSNVKWSAK